MICVCVWGVLSWQFMVKENVEQEYVLIIMSVNTDTDAFPFAFYRIFSRRGSPEEMLSDNSTNFIGADREIKSFILQVDETRIQKSET